MQLLKSYNFAEIKKDQITFCLDTVLRSKKYNFESVLMLKKGELLDSQRFADLFPSNEYKRQKVLIIAQSEHRKVFGAVTSKIYEKNYRNNALFSLTYMSYFPKKRVKNSQKSIPIKSKFESILDYESSEDEEDPDMPEKSLFQIGEGGALAIGENCLSHEKSSFSNLTDEYGVYHTRNGSIEVDQHTHLAGAKVFGIDKLVILKLTPV